jgi:hypothetical protein
MQRKVPGCPKHTHKKRLLFLSSTSHCPNIDQLLNLPATHAVNHFSPPKACIFIRMGIDVNLMDTKHVHGEVEYDQHNGEGTATTVMLAPFI